MTYRVKIEEAAEADEKGYRSWRDIYEQIKDDLNVLAVIKAVNEIEPNEPK